MSVRFVFSVIFLVIAASITSYGLFGNQIRIYKKPAPEDDQVNLPLKSSELRGELYTTNLISMEQIQPDGFGHLIDVEIQAECYS